MAALALSKTIADEYRRKYEKKLRPGTKLLGLITISAGGIHCPIFHRIMLRPGGLYRRVGETAGYTTACFSKATMDKARRLLKASDRHEDSASFGKSLRVIKSALRICDLPYEPLVKNGLPKGVYMGFASAKALENLRKALSSGTVPVLTESKVIRYWWERMLPTRISRRDVYSKVMQFKSRRLLLGAQKWLRSKENV
jgi:hypothetical protein